MSIPMIWLLITGVLALFMPLGFAMVETGLSRAKNAGHTFAMVLMILPLATIAFFIYGFALGWGNFSQPTTAPGWLPALGPGLNALQMSWSCNGWSVVGTKGFFLAGCTDPAVLALFFLTLVFFCIAATIPTGAMAERWAWGNFCLYGLWVALPFGLFAHWVWGGGWLAQLGIKAGLGHGAVDLAGSGVIHMLGGVIGLAGTRVLGPRMGKFIYGKPAAIPGHNLPLLMSGSLLLVVGWFGLNPGSWLAGADLQASVIVVNTLLAGCAGALAAMILMWYRFGKPDPSLMCNGLLAGLVAITAPCAFVSPLGAAAIGAVAGILVVYSVFYWDSVGVDDPVGAISVHGVCGAWGVLALGLFATGQYGAGWNGVVLPADPKTHLAEGVCGLFYGGGFGQLGAQACEAVVGIVLAYALAFMLFKMTSKLTPIRVSRETELQGLDIPELGALGYPDFELNTH